MTTSVLNSNYHFVDHHHDNDASMIDTVEDNMNDSTFISITSFPYELLRNVVSFLEPKDAFSLSKKTCKKLSTAIPIQLVEQDSFVFFNQQCYWGEAHNIGIPRCSYEIPIIKTFDKSQHNRCGTFDDNEDHMMMDDDGNILDKNIPSHDDNKSMIHSVTIKFNWSDYCWNSPGFNTNSYNGAASNTGLATIRNRRVSQIFIIGQHKNDDRSHNKKRGIASSRRSNRSHPHHHHQRQHEQHHNHPAFNGGRIVYESGIAPFCKSPPGAELQITFVPRNDENYHLWYKVGGGNRVLRCLLINNCKMYTVRFA